MTRPAPTHNVHVVSPTGRNGHRIGGRSRGRLPASSSGPRGFRTVACPLRRMGTWRDPHDLTVRRRSAKLGELPRMALTEKSVRVHGARPLLENSTACQQSMPNNPVRVRHRDIRRRTTVQVKVISFGMKSSTARSMPGALQSITPAHSAGLSIDINGEFDPGSGRMLAACLTHASRTVKGACPRISGERVSNTWATCPSLWDNSGKPGLIPDTT